MADLYDLEGFLAEQGINYTRPDLGQSVESKKMSPAELTGNAISSGISSVGSSLGDFLSEIARNSTSGGRAGNESYETRAMRATDNANALRAQAPEQPLPVEQPAVQEAPTGPSPIIANPLVQAVQGAATQAPSQEQPIIPSKEEETLPVPSLDGISTSRARDLEQQMGIESEAPLSEEPTEKSLSEVIASYEDRLKNAQSEAERRRLIANLGSAVNSFGAIATGRTPDSAFFQNLANQADQPVEDLKQQLELEKEKAETSEKEKEEKALEDPNSAQSVQARQLLEGILPEFAASIPNFDQLSVKALDEAMPYLNLRRQIDADKAAAAARWAKIQADLQKDDEKDKAKAKELEAVDTKQTVENLNDLDTALKRQLEIMKTSKSGGTGPLANPFNVKGLFDSDYQALENIFNKINIKNMVATFAGMSKAVDSDAERAAWNRTQPNTSLDDNVNVQILLGMQSSLLKDKIIKEAQREWMNEGKDLAEFKHPILEGNATTVVNPRTGEMVVLNRDSVPDGYVDLDTYAEALTYGDRTPLPRPSGFKTAEPTLSEEDKNAMQWLEANPDHPKAQSVREKLNRRMGQ